MNKRIYITLIFIFVIGFAQTIFAQKKRNILLIVLTHGDDVASIAPILPKYSAEGHTIYYAIFPGAQTAARYDEGGLQKENVDCGARVLGIKESFILGGPGGDGVDTQKVVAQRLIEIINQTKPDAIITWGPDGLTGHGRHIMVGNVVTRLFQQQSLLKHKPRKLYYIAYPESRFPETGFPLGQVADGMGPFGTVSDTFITTKIDGSRYLEQTRKALACFTITNLENQKWQQIWNDRIAKTLGGVVHLRLVMPAARSRETDIFKGL